MVAHASADLTLTVNGLDTLMPVEIKPNDDIIIAIAGQTDEQKEDFLITCDVGSKLTPLPEPNSPTDESKEGDYLFTFEDEVPALPIVNLTVAGKLDYQLIFFILPDVNIIVFGIDSDAIGVPEPEPGPEPSTTTKTSAPVVQEFEFEESLYQTPDVSGSDSRSCLSSYLRDVRENRSKYLMYCPVDSNRGMDTFSKAAYLSAAADESRPEEYSQDRKDFDLEFMMDDGPNFIYVDSNITTNQLWTEDNIYVVTDWIDVQALLVIEPNTIVLFEFEGGLLVNNGGTLISAGTPDEPIYYSSIYSEPYIGDYYCAIYIGETASPATTITYSYFEYAAIGILIGNIRLDRPIENNYLYFNSVGIREYGTRHTDIINNLVYFSLDSGIEVFMESSSGAADANSFILVQNNTCDCYYYQYNGITVHGVSDYNDTGLVMLINNIVSGAIDYGLNLVDGYMYPIVASTGYYDNYENKNWDFEEDNPVEVLEDPFIYGPGYFDYWHLDQSCPFIDAGIGYIEETELIGKTTDVNGAPDSNFVDLGFHYPNWNFSNAGSGDSLSADFDDNMTVDFGDFAVFADYWQQPTSTEADLDGSGFVDCNDLGILAIQWLQLADPNVQIQTYGDYNDGYVDFGVSGFTSDTMRIFLLIDGQYAREVPFFYDGQTLGWDISTLGNGPHELKAISITNAGKIICSNLTEKGFNRSLNYCVLPESYEPNKPLYFSAINNTAENISVKVYANGGNLVWSQTCDSNNIFGAIPAEITEQYEFDYISFDNTSGQSLAKKISDPTGSGSLEGVKALIVLPDFDARLRDFVSTWRIQKAFKDRGIKYKKLAGKSATYDGILAEALFENIKYMYILAHGNYQTGEDGVLRTFVQLYDGPVVSMKQSDFLPGQAPSWCEKLEGNLEYTIRSFLAMGFDSLEFVYFNTCYGGRLKINANNELIEGQPGQIGLFDGPHSDMSLALGMGEPSKTRIYQSWYDDASVSLFENDFQNWTQAEWEYLGDGESLYWAIMHAIDGQTEFDDPNAPVNTYRLKGQGLLTDIILNNN
jgi:hypothetical protein